jgi:hypothetical protein|nr:hypothetical protein [Neorhizobium tomejilense]
MFKDTLIDVRRFLTKRRGDCFGAMLSGYLFIALAPGVEQPDAFKMLGIPLLLVGALLSAVAVTFPVHEKGRT